MPQHVTDLIEGSALAQHICREAMSQQMRADIFCGGLSPVRSNVWGFGNYRGKPGGDKVSRMAVASAKFEVGQVFLPERAS